MLGLALEFSNSEISAQVSLSITFAMMERERQRAIAFTFRAPLSEILQIFLVFVIIFFFLC